jgi:hypothetical protein
MDVHSEMATGTNVRRRIMEHRWGQRVPCRLRVRLSVGAGIGGAGRLRDVSMSGAFVETAVTLPVYAPVEVVVLHDSSDREIEITGWVVRADEGGAGIEWCDTQQGSICTILGCVTRCVMPQNPPCRS